MVTETKQPRQRNASNKPKKFVKFRNVPATNNMFHFFNGDDVRALCSKLGGREAFQAYLAGRSIKDVVNEQGLAVKPGVEAPVKSKPVKYKYSLGF